MKLTMVGMPISRSGPVSTASPLSVNLPALMRPMYLSEIEETTALPSALPVYPKPSSVVLPRSSSKATI